jgi:hypothetical protein
MQRVCCCRLLLHVQRLDARSRCVSGGRPIEDSPVVGMRNRDRATVSARAKIVIERTAGSLRPARLEAKASWVGSA